MNWKSASLVFILTIQCFNAFGQNQYKIHGKIVDELSKQPLYSCLVQLEGTTIQGTSDDKGNFGIPVVEEGSYVLMISKPGYITIRLPVLYSGETLHLGTLVLEQQAVLEKANTIIQISEDVLLSGERRDAPSVFLQASRDIFLSRAAFDFGQVFFRPRGLDARNTQVMINGIPMNGLVQGSAVWNQWGGLNDVTRNQEITYGLHPSDYGFGGVLGATHIDMRPSGFRPGIRLSSSQSNRSYAGRFMATYTNKMEDKGLFYSVSSSRRWGAEGIVDGTLYDAYAVFGALEYRFHPKNSLGITAIFSPNRRGRSAPITAEVFELVGRNYNPYWGEQDGVVRNSRERRTKVPILLFNHYYTSNTLRLNTGIAYRSGVTENSRLGYYNAPNPDPTYYRYLPSFYLNSAIGANFIAANQAEEGFQQNAQLRWTDFYTANEVNGKAAYLLYDDVVDETQFSINTVANIRLGKLLKIDFGGSYQNFKADNFARIRDLLGADFHEDIDVFSDTRNAINQEVERRNGDIFNYHYRMFVSTSRAFVQSQINRGKWNAFAAVQYSNTSYKREGLFQNERFFNTSLGESEVAQFSNYRLKGGISYAFSGRHQLQWNGIYGNRAPLIQQTFINPRENNEMVPNLKNERIVGTNLDYHMRLPKWTGRLSGFYNRFQDLTDINFFFVESGVGSDFVQEVITDLDELYIGGELGLEYEVSPEVKFTVAAAVGKYVYASNPKLTINFDTAGSEEDFINPEGNVDLGFARLKDYKLARGPQKAMAFGIEYRNPKYWWLGASANYLTNNYASISAITRTPSFILDPETGLPFPGATPENVNALLQQGPLDDVYLLNLVGGKSWLIRDTYISLFASVNNLFDAVFRTGGFEQSRNGNFGQLSQDNLSGTPSFAPKYWYGRGRTYFINLAISF
ncbi:carboxypeptidase-like regulatory domain-containing protein [Spongiimicrobium salis]|uniref:carboxypeptidase-like regulatory domain-containing protein n=1 Tax=Spongiimicrobium salis TaxID=1667022 RepID=UPI00374DD4DC